MMEAKLCQAEVRGPVRVDMDTRTGAADTREEKRGRGAGCSWTGDGFH